MGRASRSLLTVISALVCLAIVVHILLGVVVAVYPGVGGNNSLLHFYRRFVVLGPFFSETRIQSKSHLLISQRRDGVWSQLTDYGCEDVADSRMNRLSAVQRRAFEVFLLGQKDRATGPADVSRALRELEAYVLSQERFMEADSFVIADVRRRAMEDQAHIDTVFQHRFRR